jgi:hypothetical protein
MSQDFHCRPSEFYGLHLSEENAWLARGVDRSVWTFGTWMRARQEETIEVEAPKRHRNERPKVRKPKYTEEQIRYFVYGPLPDPVMLAELRNGVTSMPYLNIDPNDVPDEDDYVPHRFAGRTMPNIPREAVM